MKHVQSKYDIEQKENETKNRITNSMLKRSREGAAARVWSFAFARGAVRRRLIMRSVRKFLLTALVVAGLSLASSAPAAAASNSGGRIIAHESASSASLLTTASFLPLGLGPDGSGSVWSRAWDVSADGTVLVGTFLKPSGNGWSFETHAYRWTVEDPFHDLGTLNPLAQEAEAYAVSDDGSTVVGWSRGVSGYERPYLWTAAGGMQELSKVPGTDAKATDISPDGSVIVGSFYVDAEGSWHAFQWSGGKVTDLGFLMKGGTTVKLRRYAGLARQWSARHLTVVAYSARFAGKNEKCRTSVE